MSEPLVADALQTMTPNKLLEAHFLLWKHLHAMEGSHFNAGGALAGRRAGFYHDLRAAKRQQARAQRNLRSACAHPVSDTSRQLIPDQNGLPPASCLKCHGEFCCTAVCPVAMKGCSARGKPSRSHEAQVRAECLNIHCNDCKGISYSPCILCNGVCCADCREVEPCGVTGCKSAARARHRLSGCLRHASFSFCDGCYYTMCSGCSPVRACNKCGTSCSVPSAAPQSLVMLARSSACALALLASAPMPRLALFVKSPFAMPVWD